MRLIIIRNDISIMNTDAIVLPSNPKLKEGSGASAAIFEAAGREELREACKALTKQYGDIWLGSAVPTLGYECNAKYIIHAVVPKWKNGKKGEYENLCCAYLSSIELADSMGCESLAIPLMASGNNGFDMELALEIAVKCIKEYKRKNKLNEIYLTIYGHRITGLVKAKGFEVEERIDTSYELAKDEHTKKPHEKVSDEAKKLADLYVVDGLKKGLEYIENPRTIDEVHQKAGLLFSNLIAEISKTVSKDKKTDESK